jgi:hypothetical protein
MEAPVFLLGAERSDTSRLARALGAHPQIAWPCEFDFALDWPPAAPDREWPELIDYWSALAERREAREHKLVIRAELDFPALVRSLRAQLAARARKPIVGLTAHRHFDRLLALWPDAIFLQLLRDDRSDPQPFGRRPAGRVLESRCEALERNPQRELARICDFLGVAPAAEMAGALAPAKRELAGIGRPESGRGGAKAAAPRRLRFTALARAAAQRLAALDAAPTE